MVWDLAIRRPVLTTVVFLITVILGTVAYVGLPLELFPRIDFPVVTVSTVYVGADPEEVESEVTKKIEDAIANISGIDTIRSVSQEGLSQVVIQFKLQENVDLKEQDVRGKVDLVRGDLPRDAEAPITQKFDIAAMPIMSIAVTGPLAVNELYRLADEKMVDVLSQVPGVAEVKLIGGQKREIEVRPYLERMAVYGKALPDLADNLRDNNRKIPAGHVTEQRQETSIRVTGKFSSLEEIRRLPVPVAAGATVDLGVLARVVDGFQEERTRNRVGARVDGKVVMNASVGLTIQKTSEANTVDVVRGVKAELARLAAAVLAPRGVEPIVTLDGSKFIVGSVDNVRTNMIAGILLTAIVLYLFLRSWHATVIAAVAMPVAVIITFIFLKFSGFTLNVISLLGLAIVIGVLVNNSILIVESSYRFLEKGLSAREAAARGTGDIALAVFASTATNLVVFLPVAFMGEIVGRVFKQFGLTVVYATVASLLVSYTLTPMMCAYMLRAEERGFFLLHWATYSWNWAFGVLRDLYDAALDWALRHRLATVLGTMLLFGASLVVMTKGVGFEFMPGQDEGIFYVTMEMRVGTPLDRTDDMVKRIEQIAGGIPELKVMTTSVGAVSGAMGGVSEGVNLAEVLVDVGDRAERQRSLPAITADVRRQLADFPVKVSVDATRHGPGGRSALAIEISGPDLNELTRLNDAVQVLLHDTRGVTGVDSDWRAGVPQVRLAPRRGRLEDYGMNVSGLGRAARIAVAGEVIGTYSDPATNEEYDIRTEARDEDLPTAMAVANVPVVIKSSGKVVPLSEVAEVRQAVGLNRINRKDRQRLVTVSAGLTGELSVGEVSQVVAPKLEALRREQKVSQEYRLDFGGELEMISKNFGALRNALILATLLTLLSIIGMLESFRYGFIITLSVPLAVIGVALLAFIGGATSNIFSQMGFIMIIGMVVNNAIIMMEYAIRRVGEGAGAREALEESGHERFRLIVMATLTTVVAMIPLSLGYGFSGELFQPMALVEMGGVLSAGALSLVVIPVLSFGMLKRDARRRAAKQEGGQAVAPEFPAAQRGA